MKKWVIVALFFAFLGTSGSSCKRDTPAAPPSEEQSAPTTPAPNPEATNEQGSSAPPPDSGSAGAANHEAQDMGESAEIKDTGAHED